MSATKEEIQYMYYLFKKLTPDQINQLKALSKEFEGVWDEEYTLKIDKDVPVPSGNERAETASLIKRMEVGDSIINTKRLSTHARYISGVFYGGNRKFKERKEPNGYRLWRIE